MNSMQVEGNSQSPGLYISQAEYDRLVNIAQRYACLRQKLVDQGIDNAALDLLSDPNPWATYGYSSQPSAGDCTYTQAPPAQAPPRQDHPQNGTTRECLHSDTDPFPVTESPSAESPTEPWPQEPQEPKSPQGGTRNDPNRRLDRNAQRSVQLSNLPLGTRRSDITAAVRGGPLLEVYHRPRENNATVSFVYEEDAAAFLNRAREHGLRICNSKVSVKWSEQQFVLAGHVAHQISRGATRNLVIRNRNPNITEKSIRADLDHIHNLHVLKVEFYRDECFISTNSVHNAIFARNCMMSRFEYKGSRIEWADDECAQPPKTLSTRAQGPTPGIESKRNFSSGSTSKSQMANRFQLLDVNDDDDEEEEYSSEFQ